VQNLASGTHKTVKLFVLTIDVMGLGLIGEVVRGDRDVVSALFGKVELETTV
jgi:hypothetical protein